MRRYFVNCGFCFIFWIGIFIIIELSYKREYFNNRTAFNKSYSIEYRNETNQYNILIERERKNIFFLKAHKCASSTIQNILMRFGYQRNLDFVLPASANYLGNPEYFQEKLIPRELKSKINKYNIFTHHSRYHHANVKKIMYPDAAFVTILRNPADLFESLYSFYHLERQTKMQFKDIIKDEDRAKKLLWNRRFDGKIGVNQMAWDLGYSGINNTTKVQIKKFIRQIEQEFDLVLISEYIEASLVLLCELMKWPLTNVVSLKLNSRPASSVNNLTEKERDIILNFNTIDTELYDYFLDKFRDRIHAYGVDKMMNKVKELLNLNSKLWKDCVDKPNNKGYAKTLNYDLRNHLDWTCFYSTKTELAFTDEIREDQKRRFKAVKKLENFIKMLPESF